MAFPETNFGELYKNAFDSGKQKSRIRQFKNYLVLLYINTYIRKILFHLKSEKKVNIL